MFQCYIPLFLRQLEKINYFQLSLFDFISKTLDPKPSTIFFIQMVEATKSLSDFQKMPTLMFIILLSCDILGIPRGKLEKRVVKGTEQQLPAYIRGEEDLIYYSAKEVATCVYYACARTHTNRQTYLSKQQLVQPQSLCLLFGPCLDVSRSLYDMIVLVRG